MSLVPSSSSSKRQKVDNISKWPIGDDGNFFVCVICNNEGILLCCDKCPATYHLYCLSPPLEKAPDGDWYCPNCSHKESERSPNEPAVANTTSPAIENAESGERRIMVYERRHRKRALEEGEDTQGPQRYGHDKLLILRDDLEQSLEADHALRQNGGDKEVNPVPETGKPWKEKIAQPRAGQKNKISSDKQSRSLELNHHVASSSRQPWLDIQSRLASDAVHRTNNVMQSQGISVPGGKQQNMNYSEVTIAIPSPFFQRTNNEAWFVEELDDLWRGVHMYGPHNWAVMLRDPRLRFSKHKTPEDLAERWWTERLRHWYSQQAAARGLNALVSSGISATETAGPSWASSSAECCQDRVSTGSIPVAWPAPWARSSWRQANPGYLTYMDRFSLLLQDATATPNPNQYQTGFALRKPNDSISAPQASVHKERQPEQTLLLSGLFKLPKIT